MFTITSQITSQGTTPFLVEHDARTALSPPLRGYVVQTNRIRLALSGANERARRALHGEV